MRTSTRPNGPSGSSERLTSVHLAGMLWDPLNAPCWPLGVAPQLRLDVNLPDDARPDQAGQHQLGLAVAELRGGAFPDFVQGHRQAARPQLVQGAQEAGLLPALL